MNNIKFEEDIFEILLIIDLQKQFKDECGEYEKCIDFVKAHTDDCYILGTVFFNTEGSLYEKHLDWTDCKDLQKYPDKILEYIEYPFSKLIFKSGYGINSCENLDITLEEIFKIVSEKQNCDNPKIRFNIIGCDADACVLATAFNLWDKGYEFRILTDYIYTTAKDLNKKDILLLMLRNFGDCVV